MSEDFNEECLKHWDALEPFQRKAIMRFIRGEPFSEVPDVLAEGWIDSRHLKRAGKETLFVQPEADTICDPIAISIVRREAGK